MAKNYENFVRVELSSPAAAADNTLTFSDAVAPYRAPVANAGATGSLVLVDSEWHPTEFEIVTYTGITDNGDGTFTLTGVSRSQEGTTAPSSWPIGTVIVQPATAAGLNDKMDKDGGNADDPLNLAADTHIKGVLSARESDTSTGVWMKGNEITKASIVGYNQVSTAYNDIEIRATSAVGDGVYCASDGNVGIGIGSPDEKLHVDGNAQFSNGSGLFEANLYRNNSGIVAASGLGNINFAGLGAAAKQIGCRLRGEATETWSDSASGARLAFYTTNNGQNTPYERMTVRQDGKVGIGITTPADLLDVDGNMRVRRGGQPNDGQMFKFYGDSGANWIIGQSAIGSPKPVVFDQVNSGSSSYYDFRFDAASAIKILQNGNLGIGTSAPSSRLQVNGGLIYNYSNATSWIRSVFTTNYAGWDLKGGDDTWRMYANSNTFRITNLQNNAALFVMAQGGNVGIGMNGPAEKLHVNGKQRLQDGTAWGTLQLYRNHSAIGNIYAVGKLEFGGLAGSTVKTDAASIAGTARGTWADASNPIALDFNISGSSGAAYTAMRLDYNGRLGVGTSGPSYDLHVVGDIYATGNITSASDIRQKENIVGITGAIEKINALSGFTYTKKDDEDGKRYAGVSAQDVRKVLPEVVSEDDEGMLSVAYGNLVALLIEGMKDQQHIIENLNERIETLEALVVP